MILYLIMSMNPSAREQIKQLPIEVVNLALQGVFDELEAYHGAESVEFIRGMARGIEVTMYWMLNNPFANVPQAVNFYAMIYREELMKRLSRNGINYETGEKIDDERRR